MEIVVALGLLAVTLAVAVELNLSLGQKVSASGRQVKANALAPRPLEVVRMIKEKQWDDLGDLARDTDYYLSYTESNGRWAVEEENPGSIEELFTRRFLVKDVQRDVVTGRIVGSGGEVDDRTLLVEAKIGWSEQIEAQGNKLDTYLADF